MRLFLTLVLFFLLISNLDSEEIQYVSDIAFKGNSTFSDDELSSIILLKSPKLFFRSEFNPKRLNRDIINLESFYKSNGFLEVHVLGEYVSKSEKYNQIIFFQFLKNINRLFF